MKTLLKFSIFTFFLLIFSGNFQFIDAQDKTDVVYMLDGEEKRGKVKGITETSIKFVYADEDLEYEIKKEKINKITFSSGRTQLFNEGSAQPGNSVTSSNPVTRKNKLAVLPFEVITNEPGVTVDAMGKQIQQMCSNAISEETKLDVQNPMNTNAILTKKGIDHSNLASKTPQEMAILLGVEYVVYGHYDLQNEGTRTSGSAVTTYKEKENKNKGTAISSGSSSTTINYDTKVDLSIISDTGDTIYSDSKRPFSGSLDSYESAIKYLIKRCPFGSKAK